MSIRDNKNYTRVLLSSYYTTITGWGVLLRDCRGCIRGLVGELGGMAGSWKVIEVTLALSWDPGGTLGLGFRVHLT